MGVFDWIEKERTANAGAIPCRFAGPCSWRYFNKKCLHPKATAEKCPSAYKVNLNQERVRE